MSRDTKSAEIYLEEPPEDVIKKRFEEFEDIKKHEVEAYLAGKRIIIWDPEAGFILYRNGFFGKPLGIRKPKPIKYNVPYELSFYDALYLSERNAIKVKHNEGLLTPQELIQIASEVVDDFQAKYRVYADLRDRGFIVKTGLKYGADFVVYVYGPGIDHSLFAVSVFSPNTKLRGQDFLRAGRLSWSVRKRWVLACVYNDEIRYLIFEWNKELST